MVTAFVIAIFVNPPDHDPMKKVQLAVAYGMLVLLFLFGFLVLAAIRERKDRYKHVAH